MAKDQIKPAELNPRDFLMPHREARLKKRKFYFDPDDLCKHNHYVVRRVRTLKCVLCEREYSRQRKAITSTTKLTKQRKAKKKSEKEQEEANAKYPISEITCFGRHSIRRRKRRPIPPNYTGKANNRVPKLEPINLSKYY